ncbi:MAG: pyridoxal kinase PdxY [Rhodospirillales bacterium]|nr:pyridoxal kinase PdxY [Rhodospirillales bacterium]
MGILSVQSHVSYGHVGNAAAVFLLQSMGHEVWPVHTVHFSNHPGYPHYRGSVVPAAALDDLFAGLDANGWLVDCRAVLSGYLGSAANAAALLTAVATVRKRQPDALFLCDPVIGDRADGVYVAADLLAIYRNAVVARADVVTPNLFELEMLVETDLPTVDAVRRAATTLLSRGPQTVIVTSLPAAQGAGWIATLLVTDGHAWLIEVPRIDIEVKGTGDAFAALWLGHRLNGQAPEQALARAVSGVHHLICQCHKTGSKELAIVTSVGQAIAPSLLFEVKKI